MHETHEWKDKTWHWCCKDTGGKWRAHNPKECQGSDYFKNRSNQNKYEKGKAFKGKRQQQNGKRLRLEEAVASSEDEMKGGYSSDEYHTDE